MSDLEAQLAAALARVPSLSRQALATLRGNAVRKGPAAQALVEAIDARLAELQPPEGMAAHRLEFARAMLRKAREGRPGQWIPAINLFDRTRLEQADNPWVGWMEENSARRMPLTASLHAAEAEFPDVERRKEGLGQSERVYYRRRP